MLLFGQNWLTWLDTQGEVKAESWYLLRPNFASIFSKIWSNRITLILINFIVFCDFFYDCCIFKNSVPTKQLKVTQHIVWFTIIVVISVFSACLSITKYCVLQHFFMIFMIIVNFAPTKQTKFRTLLWLSQNFFGMYAFTACVSIPQYSQNY